MFDLIVALGGGDIRKQKAIELFNQQEAQWVLFTGEDNVIELYKKFGVAQRGVLPAYTSRNTEEDFDVIKKLMTVVKFTTVIIVTSSGPHVWEARMLAGRYLYPYYTYKVVGVNQVSMTFGKQFGVLLGLIRRFFTARGK